MTFDLVTYNVLAQAYVRPDRYRGCDPDALSAGPRRQRLLRRLTALDPDLFCLQEVEPDAWTTLRDALPAHDGLFEQKPGKPDGSAILWRRGRFALERSQAVHYQAVDPGYPHLGLIAWLRDGDRSLALASTHLRWQARDVSPADHLGRLQLRELMTALQDGGCPTWVVCGDLNADHDGPVITEAGRAHLQMSAAHLRPWDTALINGRRRKLDYVLVDHGRLQPRARPLPRLQREKPIPSQTEPSDHLPLHVDFDWC